MLKLGDSNIMMAAANPEQFNRAVEAGCGRRNAGTHAGVAKKLGIVKKSTGLSPHFKIFQESPGFFDSPILPSQRTDHVLPQE